MGCLLLWISLGRLFNTKPGQVGDRRGHRIRLGSHLRRCLGPAACACSRWCLCFRLWRRLWGHIGRGAVRLHRVGLLKLIFHRLRELIWMMGWRRLHAFLAHFDIFGGPALGRFRNTVSCLISVLCREGRCFQGGVCCFMSGFGCRFRCLRGLFQVGFGHLVCARNAVVGRIFQMRFGGLRSGIGASVFTLSNLTRKLRNRLTSLAGALRRCSNRL